MTQQEAVHTIIDVINKVKQNDDETINIASDLELVLLNLKIQTALLKEPNGIEPIIDVLTECVKRIKTNVQNVVADNRDRFTEAAKTLLEV